MFTLIMEGLTKAAGPEASQAAKPRSGQLRGGPAWARAPRGRHVKPAPTVSERSRSGLRPTAPRGSRAAWSPSPQAGGGSRRQEQGQRGHPPAAPAPAPPLPPPPEGGACSVQGGEARGRPGSAEGGAAWSRGRGLASAAASHWCLPAVAPPRPPFSLLLPSPSMAPPGLIHSSLGHSEAGESQQRVGSGDTMSGEETASPSAIQISRIMRPDDANVAGNVHGGTILKMIEEAGAIISTRHCNSQKGETCVAALARVERTDFLSPMCIGEVAHVSAEITYTSKHSVEVQVTVMSENILTGARRVTNKAALWYVPLSLKNVDKVLEVPPLVYTRKEQEEEGRKRYEAQKLERMETKWKNGEMMQPSINPEPYTVSYSQSTLIHLVGPSDCTLHGFVHGGVTMKLMDEVAGIVAARHCKTNIVTASVDAINFHDKIRKGCVITISGRMTFTSNKSMEIEVLVDADPVALHSQERYRAASAFVTYVSLSKEGKTLPVPQLLVETEEEKKRFEEGKGRYLQMKAKRQAQIDAAPQK